MWRQFIGESGRIIQQQFELQFIQLQQLKFFQFQ